MRRPTCDDSGSICPVPLPSASCAPAYWRPHPSARARRTHTPTSLPFALPPHALALHMARTPHRICHHDSSCHLSIMSYTPSLCTTMPLARTRSRAATRRTAHVVAAPSAIVHAPVLPAPSTPAPTAQRRPPLCVRACSTSTSGTSLFSPAAPSPAHSPELRLHCRRRYVPLGHPPHPPPPAPCAHPHGPLGPYSRRQLHRAPSTTWQCSFKPHGALSSRPMHNHKSSLCRKICQPALGSRRGPSLHPDLDIGLMPTSMWSCRPQTIWLSGRYTVSSQPP